MRPHNAELWFRCVAISETNMSLPHRCLMQPVVFDNLPHGLRITMSPKEIFIEILEEPMLEEKMAFFSWLVFSR